MYLVKLKYKSFTGKARLTLSIDFDKDDMNFERRDKGTRKQNTIYMGFKYCWKNGGEM